MAERRSVLSGGALAIAAVVALAVIALALVFFALRTEPVPNAGETPSAPPLSGTPSPTGTPTATPTNDPTPPPVAASPATRFVAPATDLIAVRATAGSCGGAAPSVEFTVDGGVSWTPSTLAAEDGVAQIIAVEMVDADQVDLVVLTGASCAPSVLTTYTGGEYWQLYPNRLGEMSYLDQRDPTQIVVDGVAEVAPCPAPLELAQSANQEAVRCSDGIAAYSDEAVRWEGISPRVARAIAWTTPAGASEPVVAGVFEGAEGCDGLNIRNVEPDGSTFDGVDQGCLAIPASPTTVALGSSESVLWLWVDDELFRSSDSGRTWTGA